MSCEVPTKPYTDQKPGTSGLRKKVSVFSQENYVANFIQSTFNALQKLDGIPKIIVIGGDGRYYLKEAIQIILKVAVANGVRRVWVGRNGLLSTPAVSTVLRRRRDADGGCATGAFILTASHNPGGPNEDFGIKYNTANGGPAPEKLTDAIYAETLDIAKLKLDASLPPADLNALGTQRVNEHFSVEIIDPVDDYAAFMQEIFDFKAIRTLLQRSDFTVCMDSLSGASGPYVQRIFGDCLGVPQEYLRNVHPKEDFGGAHPDPNLTYAHDLVKTVGLLPNGSVNEAMAGDAVPSFGAAFDGDGDRNMIVGSRFFVNPSDSLAVLAANAACVPFFARAGGLKAVARSMPTSGALDQVAAAQGLNFFEVPTGWKFFGNLMDSAALFGKEDYNPLICGEESFGTGSNHIREKDGVWAALFWLSVLASRNQDPSKPLIGVEQVVAEHWSRYGRNYYSRYDYEGVSAEAANEVVANVAQQNPSSIPALNGIRCRTVDNFEYHDPVDGSVARKQGVRVVYEDGSRFVLRLSGTGSSGATIRVYLEQYMPAEEVVRLLREKALPSAQSALKSLIAIALEVTQIASFTGRDAPTVIT